MPSTARSVLARLEQGVPVSSVIAEATQIENFSETFFRRLISLLGQRPALAEALCRPRMQLVQLGLSPALAARATGIYYRLRQQWGQSAKWFLLAGEFSEDAVLSKTYQLGAIDSLARAGKPQQALELGTRLASELEALDEIDPAVGALLNLGNAQLWSDRYGPAADAYWRGIALHGRGGHPDDLAPLKLGLSTCLLYQGDLESGQIMAREAHRLFTESGQAYHAKLAQNNLAQAEMMLGSFDSAATIYQSLLEDPEASKGEKAKWSENLGDAFLAMGLSHDARGAYESARKNSPTALNKANIKLGLGEAALLEEKFEAALRHFRTARRAYRIAENIVWEGRALTLAGRALQELGKPKGAIKTLRDALHCLGRTPKTSWIYRDALLTLAESTLEASDLRACKRALKDGCPPHFQWRFHYLASKVGSSNQELSHLRKAFKALVDSRTALTTVEGRSQWMNREEHVMKRYFEVLLAQPTPEKTREARNSVALVRGATLIDEIARAVDQAELSRASARSAARRAEAKKLSNDSNDGSVRGGPAPGVSGERWFIGTILGGDRPAKIGQTSVPMLIARESEAGWLLQDRYLPLGCTQEQLALKADWLEFELLGVLHGMRRHESTLTESVNELRDLLRLSEFPARATEITLAPDLVGLRLPWPLLIENQEVVLSLTASPPPRLADLRFSAQSKLALLYHAPDHLPHIHDEVEYLKKCFPQCTVISSVDEFWESCANQAFDLVHVAAHGQIEPQNPMMSHIELQGGPLYAAEVARSGMRCKFASLSVCESGALRQGSPTEPQGIARGFLACGANSVAASLWTIEDFSGFQFISTFYDVLLNGETLFNSMQRARQRVRQQNPDPAYWAPMVLFGGYQS